MGAIDLYSIDAKIIRRNFEILKETEKRLRAKLERQLGKLKGMDVESARGISIYSRLIKDVKREQRFLLKYLVKANRNMMLSEYMKDHSKFIEKNSLPLNLIRGTDSMKNIIAANVNQNLGDVWLNSMIDISDNMGLQTRQILNSARYKIRDEILTGQAGGFSIDETARNIRRNVFGIVKPGKNIPFKAINARLRTIVRTTSTQIDVAAKDAYAQNDKSITHVKIRCGSGPDPKGVCEDALGVAKGEVAVFPKNDYPDPPFHPNCNCIIVGYGRGEIDATKKIRTIKKEKNKSKHKEIPGTGPGFKLTPLKKGSRNRELNDRLINESYKHGGINGLANTIASLSGNSVNYSLSTQSAYVNGISKGAKQLRLSDHMAYGRTPPHSIIVANVYKARNPSALGDRVRKAYISTKHEIKSQHAYKKLLEDYNRRNGKGAFSNWALYKLAGF